MLKKFILYLLVGTLPFFISGCWNYRGLDQLTVVAGVAIDKDASGETYQITYEIFDLNRSNKETGVKAKIIESEGKTIFDAVRNAKKRQYGKLFFGNMQVVVISQRVAVEDHLSDTIDWFLRDMEPRDTLYLVVSQESTAREILHMNLPENPVISYDIKKIIDEDSFITASTKNNMIFQAYDILSSEGISLVLPAIHKVENADQNLFELNGLAVFNGEKLSGYLSTEDSKYFLFATNSLNGGVLTLSSNNQSIDNLSLEIKVSTSKIKPKIEDGKVKITVKTETITALGEIHDNIDYLKEEELKEIEKKAEEKLANSITNTIKKVQLEFGTDIFGFGNTIYRTNFKEWKKFSDDWDNYFCSADIEVSSKIHIVNTALMKKSRK